MKKIKLLLVLCGLVATTFAQDKGIKFRTFNSWEEALATSKMEKKPIFADFFTTWCGPCKRLENEVYTNAEVGDYFNQYYIPVKVQMDRTKKDDQQVKKWYPEIKMLEQKYEIEAYPALLFIKGNGEILNRHDGFISSEKLIEMGKMSAKYNHKYVRAGEEYYAAIDAFKNGKLSAMELANRTNRVILDENFLINRDKIIDTLISTCMGYFRTQPLDSLYDEAVLEVIGHAGLKINDPLFKLFYRHTSRVDSIVGEYGFGQLIVDRAIRQKYFSRIPNAMIVKYNSEFNWDSLSNVIQKSFTRQCAERAIDAAKAAVSFQTHDFIKYPFNPKYHDAYLKLIEKYGAYITLVYDIEMKPGSIKYHNFAKLAGISLNNFCYTHIFFYSANPEHLKSASTIMEKSIKSTEKKLPGFHTQWLDTYANLLYKSGDKQKAVKTQMKVIELAKENKEPADFIKDYQETLNKMIAGQQTWPMANQ